MTKARPSQIVLMRCADAAGYAAVSWNDEDAPAVAPRPPLQLAARWRLIVGRVRLRARAAMGV